LSNSARRGRQWVTHQEAAVKYSILIYQPDAHFNAAPDDELWGAWRAYYKSLSDAGVYLDSGALKRPTTATTVRVQGERRLVQDGPSPRRRSSWLDSSW
jgi:hypothetical protein